MLHRRSVHLDGLRGLAIASVVAYHAGVFAPGWLGVHLFFGLSGYLIAQALTPGANLAAFYGRRAFRILPAFGAYLAVAAIAATLYGLPLTDFAWFAIFAGNARISIGPIEAAGLLGHLWSIAVEAQLYALAPLLVAAARTSRLSASLIVAVGFLLRVLWWQSYSTDEAWRAALAIDSFGVGVLLAAHGSPKHLPEFLTAKPLVWLGLISYSLYLWHPLVFAIGRYLGAGIGWQVVASLPVAWLSYRIVELPAQKWARRHFHGPSSTQNAPASAATLVTTTRFRLPSDTPVKSSATPATVMGVEGVPTARR